MNSKIAVGQTFPDFELPDHTKTPRRLSALQGQQVPTQAVMVRYPYCPKDRDQLKDRTRVAPQIVVDHWQHVLITTAVCHTTHGRPRPPRAIEPYLYGVKKRVRND